MRYLLFVITILLFFTACTTKEINSNADKVGGGVKNIEDGVVNIVKGKE